MIYDRSYPGAAFTEATDGDIRRDQKVRQSVSDGLSISSDWAEVDQVHGDEVLWVEDPGGHGFADALCTDRVGLPLAVFVADCFGVIVHAEGAVGVAHCGWRGTSSGVVSNLRTQLEAKGYVPQRGIIGPGIRSCCFEVGPEVAALFPGHVTRTTWGALAVDLPAALSEQLVGLEVTDRGRCTYHDDDLYSHRRQATTYRMAAIGWL